jgi:ATP-dependent DNA helicase RecG
LRDGVLRGRQLAILLAWQGFHPHRLWKAGQNNEIAIYKDRIEIYNPGTFPDDVSPEDYVNESAKAIQRNPLLAEIMYYPRYIEHFGTGLKRIHDACVAAGVDYEFKPQKLGFSVIFYRPKDLVLDPVTGQVIGISTTSSTTSTTQVVVENLNATEHEVFNLLAGNPNITTGEIGVALDITQQAASKRLTSLKSKGVIKREGSDRKGYWVILAD